MSLGNSSDASQDEMTVKEIISVYSNHPSIRKIKNLCVPENKFDLPYATTSGINKIIKSLNVNKAKGPNGISAKFVKMSVVIFVKKNCRMKDSYALNISKQTINSENYVKLLEIEIGNTLSSDKHISNLCKKSKQSIKCDRKNSEVHGL